MNAVRFPHASLELRLTRATLEALRAALSLHPTRVFERPLIELASSRGMEYLLPPDAADEAFGPDAPRARFARFPPELAGRDHRYWESFPLPRLRSARLELGLFERGGFAGAWYQDGVVRPIDRVAIVGAEMESWCASPERGAEDMDSLTADASSRLAGGLGGAVVLRRIQGTRFALAGVGRSGTLIAHTLARYGLVHPLLLLDPDDVEPHNLDAMDVLYARAIGRPKVELAAELVHQISPRTRARAIALDGLADPALAELAEADVIICAPDHDELRLHASAIAAATLRPLLDIGTGVLRGRDGELRLGADIRLVLPGEACLLCMGGLEPERARSREWREERAGSRRTLNQLAAHTGLLLLEELFRGTLRRSTWRRIVVRDGLPRFQSPRWRRDERCALCRRAGFASFGLTSQA